MDESSPPKRRKRQRFQPFVIKKGIVMRAKQRQKLALELSKSKNDSTMQTDQKLTQLRFNNRALSKALSIQKMENKCLIDEKLQLQSDLLANHDVILALRSEQQTLEDDLLQIHEAFRSSLQLLVTLTGHLNVGLQRCSAGRRRSKSVSLGTAGLPARASHGLGTAAPEAGVGSPRRSAGRKLHKVLPTVAGNVISHPSIVLPRLPPGGGWLIPPPAGAHRGAQESTEEDRDEEEDGDDEDTEEEPVTESVERGPVSAPLTDLSVILEQSVLDADSSGRSGRRSSGGGRRSSGGRRRSSAGRRSGSLPLARVVVPAEERLFGDEAWMRQATPGRERVVVAAEERLYGDEAWRRQRCRGPVRVLVPPDGRLSGDESWRRSGSGSLESPGAAARRSQSRSAEGRVSAGSAAAEGPAQPAAVPVPPAAVAPAPQTPNGPPAPTICNGDVSTSAAATTGAVSATSEAVASPVAGPSPGADLDESVVFRRPRVPGRPATVAPRSEQVSADEEMPPATMENATDTMSGDLDESAIVSRRQASPAADESISNSTLIAADPDESIIVSRKPSGAHRSAAAQRQTIPEAAESTSVSPRAASPAAAPTPPAPPAPPAVEPPPAATSPVADQDANQSVVISRKVRRQQHRPAAQPEDADQSVVISRKVRRQGPVARKAAAATPAPVEVVDLDAEPVAVAEEEPAATPVVSPVISPVAPSTTALSAPPAEAPAVPSAVAPDSPPAEAPVVSPTSAVTVAAAAAPRKKRKSKAARGRRLSFLPESPGRRLTAAAICREEATPSPELGVKERYRHMLARRSPRAAADSRVAPTSADDPLEGPSNRVWLAAPAATGRRPRVRQRSSAQADGPKQQQHSAAPVQGGKKRTDLKLSSPAVVVMDRAALAATGDQSEPSSVQDSPGPESQPSVNGDGAADQLDRPLPANADAPAAAAVATCLSSGGGDAGNAAASASPESPPAKRGRGRPRGPRGRGGRGRGRGRRSLSFEPLPTLAPDLFVYPELPAAPAPEPEPEPEPELEPEPEPEPEKRRGGVDGRPGAVGAVGAGSGRPAESGEQGDAAADTDRPAAGAESPSSTTPAAADGPVEPDSVSPGLSAEAGDAAVVMAEPTSTEPAAAGRASPEPLPWTAMGLPAPDGPPVGQPALLTPQSSPGSVDDWALERGAGRRRRKPVSYAEPSLTKKLRR